MNDVAPALLKKIQIEFQNRYNANSHLKALAKNTKDYSQANEYAIGVGELLSDCLKNNLTADVLPDGKMYYNIASRILTPTLGTNYALVSAVCEQAQSNINAQSGVGLKPVVPAINQSRVDGFVDRISSQPYEEVKWLVGEPIVNYTQSVVDDFIQQNASASYKSGLAPIIRRTLAPEERRIAGGRKYTIPCKWCEALAGEYEYGSGLEPDYLFSRHENCRCIVEYIENGKRQNVWTKQWVGEEEEISTQERIAKVEKKIAEIQEQKDTRAILLEDVGVRYIGDGLKRIDENVLRANALQLKELEDKFGAIHKSQIVTIDSIREGSSTAAYVRHKVTRPTEQDLSLCPQTFMRSVSEQIKVIEDEIESKWSMPAAKEKYLVYNVTHEYGHILQNTLVEQYMIEKGYNPNNHTEFIDYTKKTQNARYKFYLNADKQVSNDVFAEIVAIAERNNPEFKMSENLSKYGHTNKHEFFAEVFANSQLGDPNELGVAMNEWLEQKGLLK